MDRKIEQARAKAKVSVDGFLRSDEENRRLNALCRDVLTGSSGDALMEYIRSITASVVMPTSATDAELRDREGMRRLHGILDCRRKAIPSSTATGE